ncbi:MAG: response regulator transcription factor [Actinobacteria bacterium]|nr:response regulator transcription factor [Actinomycetota bacterium]
MANSATVLIVEDDEAISEAIAHHVAREGYRVLQAADGAAGLRLFRRHRPDLVVLDLMLPQIDGWRFTERIRSEDPNVPVIITSARTSEHDRVHGLQIGADDYVTKPFSMKELAARIEAHLRRTARGRLPEGRQLIEAQGLRIDPEQVQAFSGSESLGLTPREFEVLYTLARQAGKPVKRARLYREVWGYEMTPGDRSVDVFVRKLRQKLQQALPDRSIINTHYGVGYRFELDADVAAAP